MGAVWMRARSEMRARWRGIVGLGLILGLAAGAATAAATGARRTESAYPRFVETHGASDVTVGGIPGDEDDGGEDIARKLAAIHALPQIEEASTLLFVSDQVELPGGISLAFPEVLVIGDAEGKLGITLDRAKVIEGRMFDPAAADEAVVDLPFAERNGLRSGMTVGVMLRDFETGGLRRAPVKVVGTIMRPGGLPAAGQFLFAGLLTSPGFQRANGIEPAADGPLVRLKGGAEQIDSFLADVERVAPGADIPGTLPSHLAGVRKTLRFEVLSLWLLAGALALGALAIVGQAVARQAWTESRIDFDALRALGMSRRALFGLGMLRTAVIALMGGVVGTALAVVLSPLTPIGLARVVEPAPGISIDAVGLLVGLVATIVGTLAVGLIPAWRAARAGRVEGRSARPSVAVNFAASSGARPSVVAGLRMALETGRAERAVPVRQAIFGVTIGAAALVASAVFSASLTHLIDTPSTYGFNWDLIGTVDSEGGSVKVETVLRDDAEVAAFTRGGAGNVVIDGKNLLPFLYEPGAIEPTVVAGRAPDQPGEIGLGISLMRSLKLKLGDKVTVRAGEASGEQLPPHELTVVGRVVVPPFFFQSVEPGEGSAMTLKTFQILDQSVRAEAGAMPLVISYKPGVDPRRKLQELRRRFTGEESFFAFQIRQPGGEFFSLTRVSSIPVVLAAVLGLMSLATLIHAVGSTARRRRRDLAVLKTIGFVRGQVRAAVAWQASSLTATALLVGIPIGLIAGRASWGVFAESLGFLPVRIAPIIAIAGGIVAMFVVANLAAAVPARTAARTQPAVVLRSE